VFKDSKSNETNQTKLCSNAVSMTDGLSTGKVSFTTCYPTPVNQITSWIW